MSLGLQSVQGSTLHKTDAPIHIESQLVPMCLRSFGSSTRRNRNLPATHLLIQSARNAVEPPLEGMIPPTTVLPK